MTAQELGLVGVGVMGQNLALNIARHGCSVAVYDADAGRVSAFLHDRAGGLPIRGAASLAGLAAGLARPRRILLMVPAGAPVDACLAGLVPHLEAGDIVIDGGNSHFADTERRLRELEGRGVHFVGAGISGGAEGALRGPAIMPGGSAAAWPAVRPVLQAIAARAPDGAVCCEWIGPGGSGHFVKMVHNGIEYADMQLIGEAYHLLRAAAGLTVEQAAEVFGRWARGPLASYLVDITAEILRRRDAGGQPLVEQILDCAGQKGTGQWAAVTALELGQPASVLAEAVLARCLSGLKAERVAAAGLLAGPSEAGPGGPADRREAPAAGAGLVADLEAALHAGKIVCYAQGFQLLRAAAAEYGWRLDHAGIARLWRAGCIIRAGLLERIAAAFGARPDLASLLVAEEFAETLRRAQPAWRRVVVAGVERGVPLPALGAALAYYDGYRCARLPANLLQAQRDCFGAHRYERIDRPRGEFFHTDWSGSGGPGGAG